MKRILIAVDESPAAADAVAFGVELSVSDGVKVVFVHVVPSAIEFPVAVPRANTSLHEAGDRSSLGSDEVEGSVGRPPAGAVRDGQSGAVWSAERG